MERRLHRSLQASKECVQSFVTVTQIPEALLSCLYILGLKIAGNLPRPAHRMHVWPPLSQCCAEIILLLRRRPFVTNFNIQTCTVNASVNVILFTTLAKSKITMIVFLILSGIIVFII